MLSKQFVLKFAQELHQEQFSQENKFCLLARYKRNFCWNISHSITEICFNCNLNSVYNSNFNEWKIPEKLFYCNFAFSQLSDHQKHLTFTFLRAFYSVSCWLAWVFLLLNNQRQSSHLTENNFLESFNKQRAASGTVVARVYDATFQHLRQPWIFHM